MARFKKVFFRAFTVLFALGLLGLAVSLVINGYIKDQTEDGSGRGGGQVKRGYGVL